MTVKTYKFAESGLALVKPYVPAISAKIIRRFYTHGEFELKIPLDALPEFSEDMIVELDRGFFGIVKKQAINEGIGDNTATVSGYCIKYFAQKRECVVTKEENGDILGYDEVSGSTEYCMKHYVDRHIVNPTDAKRKIPFIEIGANYDRGTQDDAYYARYIPIAEILHNLGSRAKLGFDFIPSDDKTKFIFDVIESRDRTVNQTEYQPVILNIGEGLAARTHEIDSREAANTFYCTRTGYDFEDEAFTQILYADDEKAGYIREEYSLNITVDADAEDVYKEFEENAREEIKDHETEESIECEIDKNADIRLGDIVTLESSGVRFDRQITEIEYTISATGTELKATFGDKYLTKFERNSRATEKAESVAVDNARQLRAQNKQLELINFKLPELAEKQTEATEMMAAAMGFYAWEYPEPVDGWPAGQYTCAVPKNQATKDTEVWIRNAAGYAHYKNGINGEATSGMLRDDSILANAIVAGMISCAKLTTGILGSKDGKFWMDLDTWEYDFGGMLTCKRNGDGTYTVQIKMSDGTDIESAITAANEKITLVVSEKASSGEPIINSAEIVASINESTSSVTIRADKIYIASEGKNLTSHLSVINDAIKAEVKRSTDQDVELAAAVSVNSEQISLEASRAIEAEWEIRGSVETTSDKISLLVTETAGGNVINSASIVAAINGSESSVRISADKIYLDGMTIADAIKAGSVMTGYLNVTNGLGYSLIFANTQLNMLQIGGFVVARDSAKSYIAYGKSGYMDNNSGVYLGTDGIGCGRGAFFANNTGYLYANNANISGTITATSGKIAGWTITEAYFGKQDTRYGCFILSTLSSESEDIIFVRDKNGSESQSAWTYPFVLKADGTARLNKLIANGAQISGTITGSSIIGGSILQESGNKFVRIQNYVESKNTTTGDSSILDNGKFYLRINNNNYMSITYNQSCAYAQSWIQAHLGGIGIAAKWETLNNITYITQGLYVTTSSGHLEGTWFNDSGGLVTSDKNAKKSIKKLEERYLHLFDQLRPKSFLYKNGDSGRRHTGFIVQDILSAMEKCGIDAQDFAAVAHDTENGRWALRYDELIALCCAKIQKMDQEIKKLKERVA